MDQQSILAAAMNGGAFTVPSGTSLSSSSSSGISSDELILKEIGAPEGLTEEKKQQILKLYETLQATIDERASNLGELIERTVMMHKQIQTDVKLMLEQDKEEDILVHESILRTEAAERELERNPNYSAFKNRTESHELSEWVNDSKLSKLAAWTDLIKMSPADLNIMIEFKKGKRDDCDVSEALTNDLCKQTQKYQTKEMHFRVNGEPLHDLSLSTGEAARALLGTACTLLDAIRDEDHKEDAMTNNELYLLHHLLRIVKAQPLAETTPALLDTLLSSRYFCKTYATPCLIHEKPLYLAITPMAGVVESIYLRAFVLKGKLRIVEHKNSRLFQEVPEAIRCAVEKFVECNILGSGSKYLKDKFAVDLVVTCGEVKIDWMHELTYDLAQSVSWEDLCAAAARTTDEVTWSLRAAPMTVLSEVDASEDLQTFNFMLAEKDNLRPGFSCWEAKATPAAKAILSKKKQQSDVPLNAAEEEIVRSEQKQFVSGMSNTALMTTVALTATSFLAGFVASRRK